MQRKNKMKWFKTPTGDRYCCGICGRSGKNRPFVYLTLSVKWRCLCTDERLSACRKTWGADIELKVGTNEAVIAEDFKAGKCDGVSITGMRGRQFNQFTGSLDAIGAITDLKLAVKVMQGLASQHLPKPWWMANMRLWAWFRLVMPHLLVNDRNINTVAKSGR